MAMKPSISVSDRGEVLILDNGWTASYKDGVWHAGVLFQHEYIAENFRVSTDPGEEQRLLAEARATLIVPKWSMRIARTLPGLRRAGRSRQEARVLHFPDDRSIGTLQWDRGLLRTDARGEVTVPSGVQVSLYISPSATDLSPLATLPPAALAALSFRDLDQPYRRKNDDALDQEVRRLAHLDGLTRVDASLTGITDAGMVHIARLINLRELHLSYTKITDGGLVHLTGLTNLERLSLSGTAVTGDGFVHLAGLAKLEQLWLNGTAFTDAGLVHLAGLTELRQLGLAQTQVTGAGRARLQNALPHCRIS